MEKSFKMRKFFKLLCVVMMFVLSLSVTGCFDDDDEKEPASSNSGSSASFSNKGMKELEEVKIKVREGKVVTLNNQNPRNFRGAQPVAKKPFTLMVYMCGTDLEEETAAASNDIIEMAASKFKGDKLNVVILTGGTKKWNIKEHLYAGRGKPDTSGDLRASVAERSPNPDHVCKLCNHDLSVG